jgi:hypothetical protein
MVPITHIFFHYMVPLPDAVKAENVEGGSEKTDYQYRYVAAGAMALSPMSAATVGSRASAHRR